MMEMPGTDIRTRTLQLIERYDFTVKKKYGQNFLIREDVFESILRSSGLTEEDTVLEIGPGLGLLTDLMAQRAGRVIAVEIDKKLIPILSESLSDRDNIRLVNADILSLDLWELFQEEDPGAGIKVVANLPYYITTPIITSLLETGIKFKGMTFMVQREVAERMTASPGSKAYGSLSLAIQFYGDVSIARMVPPSAFIPEPGVESAIVHVDMPGKDPVKVNNKELMFELIRASFNQRRKTLYNGIKNYPGLDFPKDTIIKNIAKLGHGEMVRGEALSLEEFARLSDLFDMERAL